MGDDVDDIAIVIAEEEPVHSPVLIRERVNNLKPGANGTFMDRIDFGPIRYADADGRVAWCRSPRSPRRTGVTPGQVALAWVHHQGQRHGLPVMPLPGATSVRHLHANVAAGALVLGPEELATLDEISSTTVERTRR